MILLLKLLVAYNIQNPMTPKEKAQVSVMLSNHAKEILDEERVKLNLSQAAYLDKLLDGTLPNRLETQIEALRLEIEKLREEIKK